MAAQARDNARVASELATFFARRSISGGQLGVRVGNSGIDKSGLFTTQSRACGDVIGDYFGVVVDRATAPSELDESYVFGLNTSYQIDPALLSEPVLSHLSHLSQQSSHDSGQVARLDSLRYANHSCEPNCIAIVTNLVRNLGFTKEEASFLSSPRWCETHHIAVLPPGISGNGVDNACSCDYASIYPSPEDDSLLLFDVVVLVACRPIRAGEELTFSYHSAEPSRPCHCGSSNCRRVF